MRLKEHSSGCGCTSCQGGRNTQRTGINNIDGYASGYELAPTPDQEITAVSPDFLSTIITQVLQQLNLGGGELKEWNPISTPQTTQKHNQASVATGGGPGQNVDNWGQIHDLPWDGDMHAAVSLVDPCGEPLLAPWGEWWGINNFPGKPP